MPPLPPSRDALLPTLNSALELAAERTQRVLTARPDYTPMYTVGGRWGHEGERWTHWCDGFYPGICWLLHKHTGEARWREAAEAGSRALAPRRHDRVVHDHGFLFLPTYLRWYHHTSDPALRDVLVEAAWTLSMRRQKGGYLASFLGQQSLFIDLMMNVGLLFWAAKATGDEELDRVAREHCRVTARHLVRPAGSTAHEGIFDPATGEFLRQSTQQGLSAQSTWSRGLAWALYGFTSAYRSTGEEEFLRVARRCAEFYLRRTPAGLVPYWDYDLPEDRPRLWDSSAAAVVAGGLWDLGEVVEDLGARWLYLGTALTILQTLCGEEFLPVRRPDWEGILMHGVYHHPKGIGVDESVAWGDHFFVEALVKATFGRSDAAW
jgi:unsaturated chondroitin disaccharide hydrolase